MTTKKIKDKNQQNEGYVIFDVKTFTEVDSSGIAPKAISEKDTSIFSSHRQMYLLNNSLLNILSNKNYNNGQYIKTDTLSYDFYDLVNQKYVLFEKLSTEAKIIKRGSMAIDGSFSNTAQYDPWNGVVDSTWKITDIVINGKRHGLIEFILKDILDSSDREFAKRTKFWVDYETKNFPLQLSYILSKKLNGAFVYKWQGVFPDGKAVMVTSLEYKPAKLPDSLIRIFERWTQIARE